MDPGDLRFERALPTPEASGLERRYRFRLGGQTVDAVLPEVTATVWRQAHPDAGEGELDSWAISEGERALRARLGASTLDLTDVVLEHATHEGERPEPERRYGEGGMQHR
jgi:hypothetical protein